MSKLSIALPPFLTLLVAAGCGEIKDSNNFQGDPLVEISATVVQGALTNTDDDLRAALKWTIYSDEFIDCLSNIPEVPRPYDYYDWSDYHDFTPLFTNCLVVDEEFVGTTTSVEIQPAFPSSFELPLFELPSQDVLSGREGSYLGLADMHIFVDGNNNELLDLAPPGTIEWHDRVVGVSTGYLVEEGAATSIIQDILVYREGALSPLWKNIEARYGCTDEPPQGFSRLSIRYENDNLREPVCVIDSEAQEMYVHDDNFDVQVCDRTAARLDKAPEDAPSFEEMTTSCSNWGTYLDYVEFPDALCTRKGSYTVLDCQIPDTDLEVCAYVNYESIQVPDWWPCEITL